MMEALQLELGLDGRRPVELARRAGGGRVHAVSVNDRELTSCGKPVPADAKRTVDDRRLIDCAMCKRSRGGRP